MDAGSGGRTGVAIVELIGRLIVAACMIVASVFIIAAVLGMMAWDLVRGNKI